MPNLDNALERFLQDTLAEGIEGVPHEVLAGRRRRSKAA